MLPKVLRVVLIFPPQHQHTALQQRLQVAKVQRERAVDLSEKLQGCWSGPLSYFSFTFCLEFERE